MSIMHAEITNIKPLHDHVLVKNMNFGERKTSAGIILKGDNAKLEGIRPRWAEVYAVGPEQKEIKPGQWICVSHGRWTRAVYVKTPDGQEFYIQRVDNDDILLVSDERPSDETIGDGI